MDYIIHTVTIMHIVYILYLQYLYHIYWIYITIYVSFYSCLIVLSFMILIQCVSSYSIHGWSGLEEQYTDKNYRCIPSSLQPSTILYQTELVHGGQTHDKPCFWVTCIELKQNTHTHFSVPKPRKVHTDGWRVRRGPRPDQSETPRARHRPGPVQPVQRWLERGFFIRNRK